MIQAVTNATVPQLTISFGAGAYRICGWGLHPRFCYFWPNEETAVMRPNRRPARCASCASRASHAAVKSSTQPRLTE